MTNPSHKPGFRSIVLSTLAAAFGVQRRKNLDKDFKHGNIYAYLAAGVIFTAGFVVTVILVVQLVLAGSGL